MIDTHCHLDEPEFSADLAKVILRQQQTGVEKIIVPGVNQASIQSVWQICQQYPNYLYPALGLHPEDVKEDWQQQLAAMEEALLIDDQRDKTQEMHYIAIGEIGLDYHFDTTFKDKQQTVFLTQLRWAREHHLPVLVHSRDATEDCLRLIRQIQNENNENNARSATNGSPAPLIGVMHCFSGSHETAQQIVDLGFYLGIGGVITFKNCKLAENLQGIPLDHLLLETDAPYMAPVPHRGERNESQWMRHVAEKLSEVYHLPTDEIIHQTSANAHRLFSFYTTF